MQRAPSWHDPSWRIARRAAEAPRNVPQAYFSRTGRHLRTLLRRRTGLARYLKKAARTVADSNGDRDPARGPAQRCRWNALVLRRAPSGFFFAPRLRHAHRGRRADDTSE